jgi:hypothetical protein
MKIKLIRALSLGLSSLMIALMVMAVTPTHSGTTSTPNPIHKISPLEDPPW